MQILNRNDMKNIMAGSIYGGCGKCCYDDNPSNCSVCVDYCSGSDCNCSEGTHGVACTCDPALPGEG